MKILFTTNDKIGSRFIRWGTESDCSHLALCFDEDNIGNGIVFHSTGSGGTRPIWMRELLKESRIVHAVGFKDFLTESRENQIFKTIVTDHSGESYDDKAMLFWIVMGARKKLFNTPIPTKNAWAVAGYNLCTALIDPIQKHFIHHFGHSKIDWEMTSPFDIFHYLISLPNFYNADQWVRDMSHLTANK